VLRGDDGFGVMLAQRLLDMNSMPPAVRVVELGISGISLVQELLRGYDALIILDAVERGTKPDTLHILEPFIPALDVMPASDRGDFLADMHYSDPAKVLTDIPKDAMIVRTYEEFFHEVDAFEHGERNLLIVIGPPGTAKSTAVRRHLKNARVIEGGSTPYRLYIELYENRNLPIVLDDADKVFRDKNGVFLLKLLTQTVAAIKALGVEPDVFAPGFPRPTGRLACVGTVQTLARRLGALPAFDTILVDEAHHVVARQWRALIASQPRAVTIGFTATPERRDGKGIGVEAGGVFDHMLVGATIRELTEQGYLAKTRCFAPECKLKMRGVRVVGGDYHAQDLAKWMDVRGRAIIGDAVDNYLRRAGGLAALAFCCSVRHAERTAEMFNDAGIAAVAVHQGVPQAKRDAAFAGLRDGSIKVIASCNLLAFTKVG